MNAYVSFFYPLSWNVLLQPPSGVYVTKLYNLSRFGQKAVMIYLPLKNPTIPNWILPCYSPFRVQKWNVSLQGPLNCNAPAPARRHGRYTAAIS